MTRSEFHTLMRKLPHYWAFVTMIHTASQRPSDVILHKVAVYDDQVIATVILATKTPFMFKVSTTGHTTSDVFHVMAAGLSETIYNDLRDRLPVAMVHDNLTPYIASALAEDLKGSTELVASLVPSLLRNHREQYMTTLLEALDVSDEELVNLNRLRIVRPVHED